MKRIKNIERRRWPHIGSWLSVMMLIGGLLSSCNNENIESINSFPDGKYPLQLTAEVEQPQARSGGKDAWTGGEEIRVAMEGVFGSKTYVMDASGNATSKDAENAIYWKNTAETRITAWTQDLETETDISDQSNGYAAFDVLYATAIGRYDQAVNLRFQHRMAKIEVTLTAGEGITEEELKDATVTIFGDPITHSTAGLVSPGDQSDGEIKPYYDAATKKYEALVPPQDMTGKPFIRISIGSNAFTYTPDTEAAGNFWMFGGKRYAYTITVKANGIDVQTVTGATWSDGGEENITSKQVQLFKADELKIGDYFYSDGTWSDGGLRKRYDDGNMVIADPKPAPVLTNPKTGASRAVVGIVFQTDKSRIGAKEKEKLGGEDKVHGLVMCVKNAATNQKWSTAWNISEFPKICATIADSYNDISGYGNCEHIRSSHGSFDNYPAFKDTDGYNTTCPVPTTTTGWYLPSVGQLWDIFQNLGCVTALADKDQQTSSLNQNSWSSQSKISAAINRWMTYIADENKNVFGNQNFILSSSEFNAFRVKAWSWWSSYNGENGEDNIICSSVAKENDDCHVRPVLAF